MFHIFFHIGSREIFLVSSETVANELQHYTATSETEFCTKFRRLSLVSLSKYLAPICKTIRQI
jgi:hypothetical protein